MFTVNPENTDLYYIQSGQEGALGSLVFVHGAGGDGNIWQELVALMPPQYTSVALDLPGHNQSPGPACSSVNEYAAILAEFIEHLELPHPLILIGHSMGGAIALTLALDYPDKLDGLVLVDSGARLQVLPQFLEQLEKGILDGNFLGVGFSPLTPAVVKEQFIAEAARVPVTTFYKDFIACSRFDVRDKLDQLAIPLLLLVGADDNLTPPRLSSFIADRVSGSQLVVIPAAGHFTMLEQSRLLSHEIAKFITSLKRETRLIP